MAIRENCSTRCIAIDVNEFILIAELPETLQSLSAERPDQQSSNRRLLAQTLGTMKSRTKPVRRFGKVGLLVLVTASALLPNAVLAAGKKPKSKSQKNATTTNLKTTSSTTTSSAAPSTTSTTVTAVRPTSVAYDENISTLLRAALKNGAKVAYAGYGAGVSAEGIVQYNISLGARCVLSNVVTLEDPYVPGQGYTSLGLKMDDRFYAAPKKLVSLTQSSTLTATERGTNNVGMADIWGKLRLGPSNEHPLDAVIGHVTNRGMFEICNPSALAVPANSWLDSTPTENTSKYEQYIRRMSESNITFVNIAQGFLTSVNGVDVNPYSIIGIGCKGQNSGNTTRAASSKHAQIVTATASRAGAISVSLDILEFEDKTPAFITSRTLFNKDTDAFAQSLKMIQELSTGPLFPKADGTLATVCAARS
jgi:hypothetical protein